MAKLFLLLLSLYLIELWIYSPPFGAIEISTGYFFTFGTLCVCGGAFHVPRLRAVVLRFAIETATGSFFIWGY